MLVLCPFVDCLDNYIAVKINLILIIRSYHFNVLMEIVLFDGEWLSVFEE